MKEKKNTSKTVLIAIIDSGIETSVFDLEDYVIKSTGYRINTEGYITELPDIKPTEIHGTVISLVIKDVCSNVDFISINVLNEKLATDSRVMIYAMNEALKFHPDIIHMSLGTTKKKYRPYIQEVVDKARAQNTIVVAACNNLGFRSYPASTDGVVGVKSSKCEKTSAMSFYKKDRFYHAPSVTHDIKGIDGLKKFNGTSISAAYITGMIAKVASENELISIEDILQNLTNRISQN